MTVDPSSRGARRRAGRHAGRDRVRRRSRPESRRASSRQRCWTPTAMRGPTPCGSRTRDGSDMRATGTAAIRSRSPATGSGPSARRAARRSCSRSSSGRTRTVGASRDPLSADSAQPVDLDGRPGRGAALPGARPHGHAAAGRHQATGRATAARRADAGGRRRRRHASTRRIARHATRRFMPGPPTCPDLGFVDSNCDGHRRDGEGRDLRLATRQGRPIRAREQKPKRQIQAAVQAAAQAAVGARRYVIAAEGAYGRVEIASGIAIYGGYAQGRWAPRDATRTTLIVGAPEGILAAGATQVLLQHLSVRGNHAGGSAYGIRAVGGSSMRLERVVVTGGDGAPGASGADGAAGANGGAGLAGETGNCDGTVIGGAGNNGGTGGESPQFRRGGNGGDGGDDGGSGRPGSPGRAGRPAAPQARPGTRAATPEAAQPAWPGHRAFGGAAVTNPHPASRPRGPARTAASAARAPPGTAAAAAAAAGGRPATSSSTATATGEAAAVAAAAAAKRRRRALRRRLVRRLPPRRLTSSCESGLDHGRRRRRRRSGWERWRRWRAVAQAASARASARKRRASVANGGRGGNGGAGGGGGGGAGGPSIGVDEGRRVVGDDRAARRSRSAPGGRGPAGTGGAAALPARAGVAREIYPSEARGAGPHDTMGRSTLRRYVARQRGPAAIRRAGTRARRARDGGRRCWPGARAS